MPESPYYLIMRGKDAEARKALQWLRGNDYNIDGDFKELEDTFKQQEAIGTVSVKEFFTKGVYLKPAMIMLALMFFQQYSGINAVVFYLTDIFQKANTGLNAGLSATLVSLVQVSKKQVIQNRALTN